MLGRRDPGLGGASQSVGGSQSSAPFSPLTAEGAVSTQMAQPGNQPLGRRSWAEGVPNPETEQAEVKSKCPALKLHQCPGASRGGWKEHSNILDYRGMARQS